MKEYDYIRYEADVQCHHFGLCAQVFISQCTGIQGKRKRKKTDVRNKQWNESLTLTKLKNEHNNHVGKCYHRIHAGIAL